MKSWTRYVLICILFASMKSVDAVTHYSIPEEMEEGSVVANLASDLGLDVKMLSKRMIRLEVIANRKYLDVNKETGDLYIVERIDREHLCTPKTSTSCFLKLEAIVESPKRIFFIEVGSDGHK